MKELKTITIGSQEWMTMDLKVRTFRNGDAVFLAKNAAEWHNAAKNKEPACCYYNFNPELYPDYSLIYNWYAMDDRRKLAPEGFHIPKYMEWEILNYYLQNENKDELFLSTSDKNQVDDSHLSKDAFIVSKGVSVACDGRFTELYNELSYWVWKERTYAIFSVAEERVSINVSGIRPGYVGKGIGKYIRCIKD